MVPDSFELRDPTTTKGWIDAEGTETTERTRTTTRLILNGDETYSIAARALNNTEDYSPSLSEKIFGRRWAVIEQGGKRYLVNINSITKRLHLTREEVLAATPKGLATLISTRTKQMPDILSHYRQIFAHSEFKASGLKASTLMKVIRTALVTGTTQVTEPGNNSVRFVASVEQGQLRFRQMAQKIGEGGSGTVFALRDLISRSDSEMVVKHASDVSTNLDFVEENQTLIELFPADRNVWGIQARPHSICTIDGRRALLGKRYTRDYKGSIAKKYPLQNFLASQPRILQDIANSRDPIQRGEIVSTCSI